VGRSLASGGDSWIRIIVYIYDEGESCVPVILSRFFIEFSLFKILLKITLLQLAADYSRW
jgi:hypothetical protein